MADEQTIAALQRLIRFAGPFYSMSTDPLVSVAFAHPELFNYEIAGSSDDGSNTLWKITERQPQSLTVDAGPGSYVPTRAWPGPSSSTQSDQNPIVDAGVNAQIDIPIPRDDSSSSPDWLDKLAKQLGVSRSALEFAGGAMLLVVVFGVMTPRR